MEIEYLEEFLVIAEEGRLGEAQRDYIQPRLLFRSISTLWKKSTGWLFLTGANERLP